MSDTNKLNHYLAAWDLSHPHLLTQTMTSHIYTVTHGAETVVLKLLSPTETEEQRGALSLRYFDGHGAVRLLRYDEGAQLMEYASGDELVTLVERGADERATRIIAQVITQMHSVPQDAPHDGLVPLDRWFAALFAKAAADRQAGIESIYVRSAALTERLLADQRDIRCCTVTSSTTTSDSHRPAGSPSTRKVWLASVPMTAPARSETGDA